MTVRLAKWVALRKATGVLDDVGPTLPAGNAKDVSLADALMRGPLQKNNEELP